MEQTRTELLPGVALNHIRSDKFKTACLSLSLLTQLKRETASLNALIPSVLRRGSTRHGDLEALAEALDSLYGTAIEPVVRRIGEIQCLGFYASFPEGEFLPGKKSILGETCALLGELLLSPATRGGLLLKPYVDSEKEKLAQALESRINEKRSYSLLRCIEEMCAYEDFSAGARGSAEAARSVDYVALSKQYKLLLRSCPIEIFYIGRSPRREVATALREALLGLPRGELDESIGTEIRLNALKDEPREVTERLEVSQGKLVIGYRLGECMELPDLAALRVFNAVFGAGTTSKLFVNTREKEQMCYYASSLIDTHKGLLLVASGIDLDKKEVALRSVSAQLEAVARGEISPEELQSARAGVASDLRALTDSQIDLESFALAQTVDGLDYGPMELAALAEEVTAEQVAEIARGVECDLIYFLTGKEDGGDDEEEEL